MRVSLPKFALMSILFASVSVGVQGQPGRREPPTTGTNTGSKVNGRKPRQPTKPPKAKAVERANVTITTSPADAVLLMNGQQVEGPALAGLAPGPYILIARRVGYNEESRSIVLVAGENAPITIQLEPLRARLSVTPSVSGSEITVTSLDPDDKQGARTFVNAVGELNLAPGRYEIAIEKEGYRAIKRTIALEPAGSVYLEPQLSELPTEQKPMNLATMTMQVSRSGKYVLVRLVGGLRNQALSGFLDVVVEEPDQAGRVSGLLPGFPCEVELTPIDNISEFSVTERPESGNEWKTVAVKVRSKNNKRPLHFAIRWTALPIDTVATGKSQAVTGPEANSRSEPVTVRKRVLPSYPTAARTAHITGVVVVIVEINENGKVVSAKATEGPAVLRQPAENAAKHWEFNAARRDGVAVRASQRLEFNFQP
jgi:TonB family protein